MKVNELLYTQNFGRAFTTSEKKAYLKLLNDTKDVLDIKDTTAIVFDFNVPSKKGINTAIGSSWSASMQDFIKFVKNMTGITSIQLAPQGRISNENRSAYSGTTFAYGEHIIDLNKLTQKKYGYLLDEEYIKKLDENYPEDKTIREYKTNYNYALNVQKKALELAYNNFRTKLNPQINKLNEEFEQFKNKNSYWLEKETIFNALSLHYNTSDFSKWNNTDRDLYTSTIDNETRENRIKEIKSQYAKEIDYQEFVQFIADKQQRESHIFLNKENIKLYGDCLIGFSQSEMWANKECFRENLYYGGPDPSCSETNYIQAWNLPALNYEKLGECENGDLTKLGEVGKLLYEKYKTFFTRYDGVRIDAAWQFVTPFIYQTVNGSYQEVKMPEISNTVFNIIKAAAHNSKLKTNNVNERIMLELVGLCAGKSIEMTKNQYPHLYTTAYAEYNEYPAQFIKKGYKDGNFYTGVGNHDNDSLANLARDTHKRNLQLQGIKRDYCFDEKQIKFKNKEYQNLSEEEKWQEDFRTAKLGEIFTTSKQFFTLPDMFGMSERINISGKSDKNNWTVRIPSDYERFYFSQLSNGFGLNIPKALSSAISMKNIQNSEKLKLKCEEAAEILREKGPMTEKEANKAEKDGLLNKKFEYK